MSIALSSTGYPQRELIRLRKLLPYLSRVYENIILSIPPDSPLNEMRLLESLPNVLVVINQDWSQGRYSAIQKALTTSVNHIHYADLDKLLYWVVTNPVEWQYTVKCIEKTDCLIIGRTEKAYKTHPKALQKTEEIINLVFSYLLEQSIDLGGGSRGFNRQAAEYLIKNSHSSRSWCNDSEWVMLLHQSGYQVDYIAVDGMEAPNYAATYDTDVNHWVFRV